MRNSFPRLMVFASLMVFTSLDAAFAGSVLPTHKLSAAGLLGGYEGVTPGATYRQQSAGEYRSLLNVSKEHTWYNGDSIKASGFSFVGDNYGNALSVAASSNNRGSLGQFPGADGIGLSAVRDVLLTDGDVYGASVRLTFDFWGFATREVPAYFVSGRGGVAGMSVYVQGFDILNFQPFNDTEPLLGSNSPHVGFDYTGYIEDGVSRGRVDRSDIFMYGDSVLSADGDFHVDAFYDAELGGYGFAVAMTAMTRTTGGFSESEFFASLRDITYKDQSFARSSGGGTNYVDLSTARFDSGMSGMASPVPEPASLAMWGAGAFGAFMVRRRRQNRSQAA